MVFSSITVLGGGVIALALAAPGVIKSSYRRLQYAIAPFWIFSWISQNFPLHLIIFSLFAECVFFAGGAYRSFAGCTGQLLLVAAMGCWLTLWLRALSAHAVIRGSILDFIDDNKVTDRSTAFCWLDWMLPWRMRRAGLCKIEGLPYGPHGNRNLLDIYRPDNSGTKRPILIQVHGGAWTLGNKGLMGLPLTYRLASSGWMVVDVNYRLGPEHRFPAMLDDVKAAIRWVHTNAEIYGGDRDFICLSGGSAGGHLSTLAGLFNTDSSAESETVPISAVVPLYSRFDLLDRNNWVGDKKVIEYLTNQMMPCSPNEDLTGIWFSACPIDQVHADAPAFFIVHGSNDCLIPPEEARDFAGHLRSISHRPVIYSELPGAQHAFDIWHNPWTTATMQAIHTFLDACHAEYLAKNTSNAKGVLNSAAT